jgi:hypothetical protein
MGTLSFASKEIKNWINVDPEVGEESLTDRLYYHLSSYRDIRCHRFNRRQEGKSGADMVWCFRISNNYYLMYVQAKKLNKSSSKNHSGINYRDGKQFELLTANAKSQNMLASYMFYTNIASTTKCRWPYEHEGVFLANAHIIKGIDNKYISNTSATSPENILKLCIGISCIERCPLIFDESSAMKGFEVFINTYMINGSESFDNDENLFYKHDIEGLPGYLKYIVRNIEGNNDLPDWFEEEFRDSIDSLSGVIIYDIPK